MRLGIYMKLSRKLMMVSAAALLGVSPVLTSTSPVHAAKSTKTTKKTNTGDKTVLAKNAYIYDKNGKRNTNYKYNGKTYKSIAKDSTIETYGTVTIKGKLYFDIGNGNYIKAANVGTVNGKKYSSSKKTSSATTTKTSTKSVELTHNAYVYDKNGKRIKSAGTLKKGSTVEYTGTKTIKGKKYYNLGNGQYVKTTNAKKVETKTEDDSLTGTLNHNAYVYDKNGKRIKSVKTLKKGTTIKYIGTETIKNKDYYNLGNGQYVKAANVDPDIDDQTGDDKNVEVTYIKLIKNAYIYDENGERVANSGKLFKGLEYQTVRDGAKKINDKWYYQIGYNQYIKAVNAVVSSGPTLIPADEDPAKPTDTSTESAAIVTWKTAGSLYNYKGETISGTYFSVGHQARVSKLTYLWIASENKAELFYQIASKVAGVSEAYVKADMVSSDTTLTPDNTQEEAKDDVTEVKPNSYTPLKNAIDAALKAKETDAYTLASPSVKADFDKALKNAQDNYESTGSTVHFAKQYINALTAAQGQLNGKKVQVTDLNNLTSTEQQEIIQSAATANGVETSAVKFSGNSNLEITSASGYVSTKPVTDYATATPQTAASVN